MWKPKSNKITSRGKREGIYKSPANRYWGFLFLSVSNTFSGKSSSSSCSHYLGLSPQRDRRRNSGNSCRPPPQQQQQEQLAAAATDLSSDGSTDEDTATSTTTPTSPSSKSSSLFDLSVFGKSPARRRHHHLKLSSSSQIHPGQQQQQHPSSHHQFHSTPMPYIDMPLQFNFGSTYASSLTVFFDNWWGQNVWSDSLKQRTCSNQRILHSNAHLESWIKRQQLNNFDHHHLFKSLPDGF